MTRIISILALAASVAACSMHSKMYDSNMHEGMMKKGRMDMHNTGKYDYPPYNKECPADYRMKGWC